MEIGVVPARVMGLVREVILEVKERRPAGVAIVGAVGVDFSAALKLEGLDIARTCLC